MQIPHKPMNTQSVTPQRQRYRDILKTAQALADGKDPADFPEYGFSPKAEGVAEVLRKIGLTALHSGALRRGSRGCGAG